MSAATDARAWLQPRADGYLALLGTLVGADDLPRCHAAVSSGSGRRSTTMRVTCSTARDPGR